MTINFSNKFEMILKDFQGKSNIQNKAEHK